MLFNPLLIIRRIAHSQHLLRVLLLIIVAVSLTACIPRTHFVVLQPDYQGIVITDASLAVLTTDPVISNSDDVIDDLGTGIPQEVFQDFFGKTIPPALLDQSHCREVSIEAIDSSVRLRPRILDIDGERQVRVKLPDDGTRVGTGSFAAEFLLFIENLSISRIGEHKGSIGGDGSTEYLQIFATFALWDNRSGRLVSGGETRIKATVFFAMTKGTWETALRNLARNMLKDSPFYRPPTTRRRGRHRPKPVTLDTLQSRTTLNGQPTRRPRLSVQIDVYNSDQEGSEVDEIQVRPVRSLHRSYLPLLPVVLFAKSQTSFPEHYTLLDNRDAGMFDAEALEIDDMTSLHSQILNIIGARMAQHSSATLRLEEIPAADENTLYRGRRAELVKDYFVNTWRIAEDRIAVESQPSVAGDSVFNDVARVNLTSSSPLIVAPVVTQHIRQRHMAPGIGLKREIEADAQLRNWQLTIRQDKEVISSLQGKAGSLARLQSDFLLQNFSAATTRRLLTFELEVTDSTGQQARASDDIHISTADSTAPLSTNELNFTFVDTALFPALEVANEALFEMLGSSLNSDSRIFLVRPPRDSGAAWGATDLEKRLSALLTAKAIAATVISSESDPRPGSESMTAVADRCFAACTLIRVSSSH